MAYLITFPSHTLSISRFQRSFSDLAPATVSFPAQASFSASRPTLCPKILNPLTTTRNDSSIDRSVVSEHERAVSTQCHDEDLGELIGRDQLPELENGVL
jgi:hypothetical protein